MIEAHEQRFMDRAIALAREAEGQGNLPIGAVIVLDGEIIGEGQNAILVPLYKPGRHAEMEALGSVPDTMWEHAQRMTCYTTLEPCMMCMGGLLLHGIGRVVFGAVDVLGGSGPALAHLPAYYTALRGKPEWVGPVRPDPCDAFYERVHDKFKDLPCG